MLGKISETLKEFMLIFAVCRKFGGKAKGLDDCQWF